MFDIHYFDNLDSTMNVARDDLVHGRVIQAGQQTSGRGRRGNEWQSPKGNIYKSIILKPDVEKQLWGQLSFVIAVALAKTVLLSCGLTKGSHQYAQDPPIKSEDDGFILNLKWPNDVLINDKKLAGILIEVVDDYVIIGTGVNIESCTDDRAKIHDFTDISVNDFRDEFLNQIETYYNMWQADGFVPIRALWMRNAYRLGEHIQARLPNVVYEGVFEDLDETGILLLREKDGNLRQINSGEILV